MPDVRPSAPSDDEIKGYYYGFPSKPKLVARTSFTPWHQPSGAGSFLRSKRLRPLGRHRIAEIWEEKLVPQIHTILCEGEIDFNSIEAWRIGHEPSDWNVIVWIGVEPQSLSFDVGIEVAFKCKQVLLDCGVDDAEVEIKESKLLRLAGARLQNPSSKLDVVAAQREPFTSALGIPICAQRTPWASGTGGFFIDEGGEGKRLFLVTVRHVAFPDSSDVTDTENKVFMYTTQDQDRHNILVLDDRLLRKHLDSLDGLIHDEEDRIREHSDILQKMKGKTVAVTMRQGHIIAKDLATAKKQSLETLRHDLKNWTPLTNRILGHVLFSPRFAVGVGRKKCTDDIAVIEVDPSMIDWNEFMGNVISLRDAPTLANLDARMNANITRVAFPSDYYLLHLQNIISDEEMKATSTDPDDRLNTMVVLKSGMASGLTVGLSNNIRSFTRYGRNMVVQGTSWEWAIVGVDGNPFSEVGDSGSVVVDGHGRIGGMLTSGNGHPKVDVTYATPITFILDEIRSYGPLANARLKPGPYDDH
ncbi:hypothetical protein EIP91_007424 [Steccherinum ochraceum]|uniref:Serine protease n=1 Tax=Steccherinum ochraceum TaxID=92696 RepID=A0A4R0S0S3_9APHY|nr:hypothetical protein EIP91_007424 [Steccherinum ochraceum]